MLLNTHLTLPTACPSIASAGVGALVRVSISVVGQAALVPADRSPGGRTAN